jgi:gliding motility-associated-like protein
MALLRFFTVLILLSTFAHDITRASHIVGGGFTYQYIDSGISSGTVIYHYRIKLTLYQDYLHGQPEAIAQDNPAFFTIYDGSSIPYKIDTTTYYTPSASTILSSSYATPCGSIFIPPSTIGTMKRVFEADIHLPHNPAGYTIVYQRCCRSSALVNITDAGNTGVTYFCHIPASPIKNASAVFANDPPLVVCLGNTTVYDLHATDADGDSLTYELSPCYLGADGTNIKPVVASAPPYDSVHFAAGASWSEPMGAGVPVGFNPTTGRITVTPDHVGLYLIGISCHEWRNGTVINTTKMEFNCLVINCAPGTYFASYHPYAGNDTTIMVGESVHFHASYGASFSWSPATFLSDPSISDPIGHFTSPGLYSYVVAAVSDSGCTGTDTVNVNVIEYATFVVPNAFTPNGDNHNDYLAPIPLKNPRLKTFRVFNRAGRLLFESNSSSASWDGTYNGWKQDVGTYVWELLYEDDKGVPRELSGNVMLLR